MDKRDKTNYRPASIFLNTAKIYEKRIYKQLYEYFSDIHFPSQRRFRKGYNQCITIRPSQFVRPFVLLLHYFCILLKLDSDFPKKFVLFTSLKAL